MSLLALLVADHQQLATQQLQKQTQIKPKVWPVPQLKGSLVR